jgi:hypothetical protein
MKRGIKITLITVAVLFGLIIVAAFAVPYLFKDQILVAVKDAANKSLNAKMDFSDVNLSLFRDFPDVSVRLENLKIRNVEPFEDIHLADVEAADVTVDLMSIIRNQKPWRIKYIGVTKPRINVFVLEDGRANYDIMKPTADTTTGTADEPSGNFNIALDAYKIEDANLLYDDEMTGVVLSIKGLNHSGSGDFTETIYDLDTDTDVDSMSLTYGGIPYLKKAHTTLDAIFNIDQANRKYVLKDNTLKINELTLKADGFIQMPDTNNIVLDLKFSTPENDFKNLLSLIPNAYIAGYEKVKAEGTFELSGFAKGTYNAVDSTYPAFQVNLGVNNANIKYPDLPLGIANINTKVNVNSPTSNFDDLVVDVPNFAMTLGSNPIRAVFNLKTPISDPDVNTQIEGTLNLKELSQAFPMEGVNALTGIITADVDVKTRLSTIEAQRYDQVNMRGTMGIQGFNYKDAAYPAIRINNAQAAFTPENVRIQNFDAKLGKSDVKASGSIQNILAYFSPKKTMRGAFTVRSNYFDANEWMPQETAPAETKPTLPASGTAGTQTEIFDRFDMTLDAELGQIVYDVYKLKNTVVKGHMKPNKLVAQQFSTVIGDSDVRASGTITNLFDYLFDNQTLGGNIAVQSKLMNLNQFMTTNGTTPPAPATTTEATPAATANMEPILVPENIDMTVRADVDKLVYTNLVVNDLIGKLLVKDQAVVIENATANTLGGKMAISGGYDTKDATNPTFNLKYDLQNMDFQRTFKAFNSFQVLAPIGAFIAGNFNTSLILDGTLGKDMMPKFSTLNAEGFLETINGIINNFKPLQAIGDQFNIDYFKEALTIKNTRNWFELKDGTVEVKEFDYQYKDIPMKIGGTHGLNQDINYIIKAKIPRKLIEKTGIGGKALAGLDLIKKEASKFGVNLANSEFVNVQFNLTGSIKKPNVGFKLLGTGGEGTAQTPAESVKDEIKQIGQAKIEEGKQVVKETAAKAVDSVKTVVKDKAEQAKDEVAKKAEEELKDRLGNRVDSTTKEEIKSHLDKFNPFKKKKKEEPKDTVKTGGN